ncbi:MAG: hypothetical protein HQL15_08350 [Candidatus Omnitrophica bacterium]|nr:hypothetical protein [Candidatus Omnitrophota bacterium]
MKNMVLILSVFFCGGCLSQAYCITRHLGEIKSQDLLLSQTIREDQQRIKEVEILPQSEIGFVKESYVRLDAQVRQMSRYYDYKASLEIKNLGKDQEVLNAVGQTAWPGIHRILAQVDFYDLKGQDQMMTVFKFLEDIQRWDSLRLVHVDFNNNHLQAELQLYGR